MGKTRKVSVLRVARVANALTLEGVAEKIGRSRMFVSRVERGGSARVTPEIADKISATLGVPVNELFEEIEE